MTDAVRARISERRDSIIAALKERRRTGPEVRRRSDRPPRAVPADRPAAGLLGRRGRASTSSPPRPSCTTEWAVPALDAAALEKALSVVARRHEMLRVVPRDDGSQAVPPEVTPIPLTIEDRRGLDSQTAEAAQAERRSTIDRHLSPIDGGAQLTVVADRYDDGWRVHLLMRLFVFDGRSLDILGATLAEALASGADPAEAAPQDLSYADCQRAIAAFRDAPAWRRAWDYWAARADSLPGAPELPVAEGDRVPGRSRFGRRQVRLDGGRVDGAGGRRPRARSVDQRGPGKRLRRESAPVVGRRPVLHQRHVRPAPGRAPPGRPGAGQLRLDSAPGGSGRHGQLRRADGAAAGTAARRHDPRRSVGDRGGARAAARCGRPRPPGSAGRVRQRSRPWHGRRRTGRRWSGWAGAGFTAGCTRRRSGWTTRSTRRTRTSSSTGTMPKACSRTAWWMDWSMPGAT